MDKKQDLVADILEPIVDKHGLLSVVTALQLMCEEKAMHIRTNWQDDGLAKEWDKASRHFERSLRGIADLTIS